MTTQKRSKNSIVLETMIQQGGSVFMKYHLSLLAIATVLAGHVQAAPATNSAPQPTAIVDTIPSPIDKPYLGVINLNVDATDTHRGIFRVTETLPVQTGPLTLLYPEWLPGHHSPSGPIEMLAGLVVIAHNQVIPWQRDPVDVYAFHLNIPEGVTQITAEYQYLSPTAQNQGRIQSTPEMANLQWNTLALYPAGYFTRQIQFQATVTYPTGWKTASALEIKGLTPDGQSPNIIQYQPTDLDTLIDSPVMAGRYTHTETLAPGVRLNLIADKPEDMAITDKQLAAHRNLITQAVKLYGAQHYSHYDFLLALSDKLGGIGLEHHQSSEDGEGPDYFTKWDKSAVGRDLLAHEYNHSWNGKFRRPADLWTPDYRTPMRDSLLWVYEGQTQFWGYVLAARSGLWQQKDALEALALVAATYDNRAGRRWRPVEDTTNDPIISQRRPKAWLSWQRSEDYYSEGQLIWLDVDSLLRQQTHGKHSLDDFAKAFFGMRDRDWGQLTYNFDDVVKTLNDIMPYDWASFFNHRLNERSTHAPLDWIARGGYQLVYKDEATDWIKGVESARHATDLSFSLGLTASDKGKISGVMWDSPAFNAGLTVGSELVAVDEHAFSADLLKTAIKNAKSTKTPIKLLVKQDDNYREVFIPYYEGLRYPHLEKIGKGDSSLEALLAPKA